MDHQREETVKQNPAETSLWPLTIWPEVRAAAEEVGIGSERLNQLCLSYQKPLRVYFLYLFKSFPEILNNADDLLQGFVMQKILHKGWLARANPQSGKFRNYLKTSLRNYVRDWAKKARIATVPLDDLLAGGKEPPVPERSADDFFDLAFTQAVLKETLERMEQHCRDPRREQPRSSDLWDLFAVRVLDPIFKRTEPPAYKELVQRFKLKSPTEGSNMLLTAKRMFKRHLEEVVAEFEGTHKEAQSELARLTEFVARLTGPEAKA